MRSPAATLPQHQTSILSVQYYRESQQSVPAYRMPPINTVSGRVCVDNMRPLE
jgi:hypothetical protein